MINTDQQLEINPEIILQELEDQTILLNPNTGQVFGLDRVSTRVWELLSDVSSFGLVKQQMLEDFEVDEEQLTQDLHTYIGQLLELGLVRAKL